VHSLIFLVPKREEPSKYHHRSKAMGSIDNHAIHHHNHFDTVTEPIIASDFFYFLFYASREE
jgi:hypothetical protein